MTRRRHRNHGEILRGPGPAVNYCRTCRTAFRWTRPRRFFIRREPAAGSQERRRTRGGAARVRAATKVSSGSGRRRLPRPVASRGPRYRYDVDIWRALLLHPRPARRSVLSLLRLRGGSVGPCYTQHRRGPLVPSLSLSLVSRARARALYPPLRLSLSLLGTAPRIFSPLFGPPSVAGPRCRPVHAILSYYKAVISGPPLVSHL